MNLNYPGVFSVDYNNFKFLYTTCKPGSGSVLGGFGFKDFVNQCVKRTGLKQHYNHAHEWCCGYSAMGFNLLNAGICDLLTLSDVDYDSVMSSQYTAVVNNIKDKTNIYLIENFSDIPVPTQPWDLIVTNPPYVPNLSFYEVDGNILSERDKTAGVDPDWVAHKNFFENVKKYIEPGCDIYMFGITEYFNHQIKLAKYYGLNFIQNYNDLKIPGAENLELLHFRPN